MNTFALQRLHPVAEIDRPGPSRAEASLVEPLSTSLLAGADERAPFRHLRLQRLLPAAALAALAALPCAPPVLAVMGRPRDPGRRTRRLRLHGPYAAPVCQALARAFAATPVVDLIARRAGVEVAGCPVRLSLVREVDGYACEPRTAEGEARFRFVVALSPAHQADLGPDLYADPETWAAQLPWSPGAAFAFAPAADTWHGFEPRLIRRLRASLVVDYLTGGGGPPSWRHNRRPKP